MKKHDGFTLIELLVVIAIIAILAAILFPVFASARERGRVAKCISNLKNLSAAIRFYTDDNNGRMPSAFPNLGDPKAPGKQSVNGMPDWCGCVQCGGMVIPEKGSLWRYTRTRGVYICPSDVGVLAPYGGNSKLYPLSYSMNQMLSNKDSWLKVGGAPLDTFCRKLDSLPLGKPTSMMLFLHESRAKIDDGNCWPGGNPPSQVHYDGTSLAYVDGHAAWRNYRTLRAESKGGKWFPDPGYPPDSQR